MNVLKESQSYQNRKHSQSENQKARNIIEVENQLKLLELKHDYNLDKENFLIDVEHPPICRSQTIMVNLKLI